MRDTTTQPCEFSSAVDGAEVQTAPAVTARPQRNQSIEMLRIIASFGVIAYHSLAPFHDLALSGLVIFLMLTPYLSCRYEFERHRPVQALARIYLVPWAFWFLVYGVASIVIHKPFLTSNYFLSGILFGSAGHLWFLPAMFLFQVALNALRDKSILLIYNVSILAACLMLLTVPLWRPASLNLPPPLPQWIHAAPVMCLGIALGLFDKIQNDRAILVIILLAISFGAALTYGVPSTGIPYLIGVVCVGITVRLPTKPIPTGLVQPFSELTMGIYLTHVFWLSIFNVLTGPSNYITVTLCYLSAAITTYAVRRFIPFSKVVLG